MADTLIDIAKSMIPLIRSSLDRLDAERQLPSELASAMAQKHLFGLYVPKELGGPETDPITAFRVVEEIAQVDGSVGWCVFNGTAVSSAVARLSPRAAKEIFGDPPLVLGSGSARAEGTAKRTEGEYLVTGRWNFLSGIDHAIALFLACRIIDDNGPVMHENGTPLTRTVVVPVASGKVHNTWTTLGMRGTASNDAEFCELFVPADHTYTRGAPAHDDGPLSTPPQSAIVLGWTLSAANTLGMARGAMHTFLDLATNAGSTNSAYEGGSRSMRGDDRQRQALRIRHGCSDVGSLGAADIGTRRAVYARPARYHPRHPSRSRLGAFFPGPPRPRPAYLWPPPELRVWRLGPLRSAAASLAVHVTSAGKRLTSRPAAVHPPWQAWNDRMCSMLSEPP